VFSHIFIGVKDFERGVDFYTKLMGILGNTLRFRDRKRPWAGWQSHPEPRPLFLIGVPHDGNAHDAGNGQMVAFAVEHRAAVDNAYRLALESGASSAGSPGVRPEYHEHYYAAYLKDPDGNKLCIVCHSPAL
jgi:catechol 2,3-dioxygenase-like lactoylglutathione lyase family enzyme